MLVRFTQVADLDTKIPWNASNNNPEDKLDAKPNQILLSTPGVPLTEPWMITQEKTKTDTTS